MPGLAFLFKKGFHPVRFDNQKKLFIAEQEFEEKKRREAEAAEEVAKEAEINYYEQIGEITSRDPRSSSLKFMYSVPKKVKDFQEQSKNQLSEEVDPYVLAFQAKLKKQQSDEQTPFVPTPEVQISPQSHSSDLQPIDKTDTRFSANANQSSLEKLVGRKHRPGLSGEELNQNPILKNAPTEGIYTKGIAIRHQPFSVQVRNVKCSQCGEWGHQFGDRECKLRDYNPHDFARQQREDPLSYMQSAKIVQDKQQLIKNLGTLQQTSTSQLTLPEIDESDEDPEALFLSTLTPREKKLLLRKLQEIEGIEPLKIKDNKEKEIEKEKRHIRKRKKKHAHKGTNAAKYTPSSSSNSDTSSSEEEEEEKEVADEKNLNLKSKEKVKAKKLKSNN